MTGRREPSVVTLAARTQRHSVTDAAILGELLRIHAAQTLPVLDTSGGRRRLWSQDLLERWRPIFLDRNPAKGPDIVGDWNHLDRHFSAGGLGTILADPPHAADWGRTSALAYATNYAVDELKGANAVNDQFAPLLASVGHVLDGERGTFIIKLADQVHGGELQAQPFVLWATALEQHFGLCDYKVRQRAQPKHNSTRTRRHIRRAETFWMVFHPTGALCSGAGIPVRRECWGCGSVFGVRRFDQYTCGKDACRQRLARARRAEDAPMA